MTPELAPKESPIKHTTAGEMPDTSTPASWARRLRADSSLFQLAIPQQRRTYWIIGAVAGLLLAAYLYQSRRKLHFSSRE